MKRAELSVIFIFYRYVHNEVFSHVLDSLLRQSIPLEIIVCQQDMEKNSKLIKLCENKGAKYVFSRPDIIDGKVLYNVGRLRNTGAVASTKEYIYYNDSDVFVYDDTFFENMLKFVKADPSVAYIHPKMKRLVSASIAEFDGDFAKGKKIIYDESPYCFVEYLNGKIVPIKEGEINSLIAGKPFVIKKSDFTDHTNFVLSADNPDDYKWVAAFHFGGILCSKSLFMQVGGYYEGFHNWGMEDTDIQWKFAETTGVFLLDRLYGKTGLLHMEHPCRVEISIYKENIAQFEKRLAKGVTNSINEDKEADSFIGRFLKGGLK